MWSVWTGAGVGVLLILLATVLERYLNGHRGDIVDTIGGCIVFGVVGAVIGFFVAFFVGRGIPTELRESSREELVSMRSADGAHGSFFLGSGSIHSEPFYFYYKKTPLGLVRESKQCGSNVYVVEEDRTDGMLVTMTKKCTRTSRWGFCLAIGGGRATFYIPRGSVAQIFDLK